MQNKGRKVSKKEGKKRERAVNANAIEVEERSPSTRSIIVLAITCIGIAILFASWISQNYFKSRWLDEKSYLEKSQLLIVMETAYAKQWEIIFNAEANEDSPNKARHLLSAYNYIKSITTILAWEEARVAEDIHKEAPIVVKNLMHAKAKGLLINDDINGLTKLVVLAGEAQNKYIKGLDEKYFAHLAEANARSAMWDKLFLVFYIIGSLLIGTRWWLVNVLSWPNIYVSRSECTTQKREINGKIKS